MGILNRLLGYRWSLYIVQNDNELCYAMHGDSVMGIVGYVMTNFEDGLQPVEPWSLYLNFNHKNQTIKLVPEHFNGNRVSHRLIEEIEAIDTGWKLPYREPIFEEAATKKRLSISGKQQTIQEIFEKAKSEIAGNKKPEEVTFFSVMSVVFGKS